MFDDDPGIQIRLTLRHSAFQRPGIISLLRIFPSPPLEGLPSPTRYFGNNPGALHGQHFYSYTDCFADNLAP